MMESNTTGQIVRIAGPVVGALGLANVRLYDVVRVGTLGLVGEVIRLDGDLSTIQVYEETNGVKIGEPVTNTGAALAVDLGPGLLGTVYDGLQRPLEALAAKEGYFLSRGTGAAALNREKRWQFTPAQTVGTAVSGGDILGFVQESATVKHAIMVPHGIMGGLVPDRAVRGHCRRGHRCHRNGGRTARTDDAPALAGADATAVSAQAESRQPAHHRHPHDGRFLPGGQGRKRDHSRRFWHGQDGHRAGPCSLV